MSESPREAAPPARRYEIDWLRVFPAVRRRLRLRVTLLLISTLDFPPASAL